jgi:hypothetical protein
VTSRVGARRGSARVEARVGARFTRGSGRVYGSRVDLGQKIRRNLHRRVAARGALSGFDFSGGASS